MRIITDPHCTEYSKTGNPEQPARVSRTIDKLRSQNTLSLTWEKPALFADETILLRAHSPELLSRLHVPFDYEEDTPAYPEIATFARQSVSSALSVLDCAQKGELAFSLMRPPGHHATRDHAMGFSYLNNIAVAVLEARVRGFKRVVVFDFDLHHGNGTEDILLNKPGVAFASVHQFLEYPWTGKENVGQNCFNYPVCAEAPRKEYLSTFTKALERLKQFKPDLIAVSAGFDAYKNDPLSHQNVEIEDYHALGKEIRDFQIPVLSVLEGGYSDELPELIFAYLCGLDGK
jgi:acetoin utilization deacetylase AcuC-like enzyme